MYKTSLFILGGSSFYTLLLFDAIQKQQLTKHFTRITLFGRNKARLALLASLGNTVLGEQTKVDTTTNFDDCLASEYGLIFNQIRFGNMSSRDVDERIALSLDMPADETIGIVGASNGIRAIEGLTPYLTTLRQKSSPYLMINFTNPCSLVTQYMLEYFDIPVVGVCDYPQMMKVTIAEALSLPIDEIELGYFGLNHFGIIHSVRHKQQELLADVLSLPLGFKPNCNQFFDVLLNVSWRYIYEPDEVVKEQQSKTNRASQLLEIESEMEQLLSLGERDPKAYFTILAQRNCDWFTLVVAPLIAAVMEKTSSSLMLNVNTKDPLDIGMDRCIVECHVDKPSFDQQRLEILDSLKHSAEFSMIKQMKLAEHELLLAVLAKDKNRIIRACLLNPMIGNKNKIQAYFTKLSECDPQINAFFNFSRKTL